MIGITKPQAIAPTVNRIPKTKKAVLISPALKPRIRNWARFGAPAARNVPTLNQAPNTALAASQAGAKRMMRRFSIRLSHARSRTNTKGINATTYITATMVNASCPTWSCSLPPMAAPTARPTTVAAS